ncbi:MAG: hypothetical protein JSS79_06560 [Bacteroidetes bacterium]|nr:hypothetical protein [Bacteroidota bacterium]
MKRKFFAKHLFLALGILVGFIVLGLVIKSIRPQTQMDSFLVEGIILSSLPFWLTQEERNNCKTLKSK